VTAICPLVHRSEPERPRRAAHGLLCAGHARRLLDDLASMPGLHDTLSSYLVRTGGGDGGGRGGNDSIGINLDPGVVKARDHIRHTLVSWACITLEEGPWTFAPDDEPRAIAAWLLQRRDWLMAQAWADELAANVSETVREARAQIQPNATYRVELGPCPLLTMDGEQITSCEGTVVAVMHRASSREQLPSEVVCTAHGDDEENPHAWGPMEWHALGRRMGRSLHTSAADAFLRAVSG
jgi:hypothetical protein